MKTSAIAVIALFLMATLFVGESNAQGRMGKRQGMRMGQCFRADVFSKLNLTDAQKDKINSLREAHQKTMIDLRAQVQKDALTLKDLRLKENVSRQEVISAVEKLNKSRDAMALARANHLLDVREVLTPDQRKLLKDTFPGMMMRKHRGKMGGNGMGMGLRGKGNF